MEPVSDLIYDLGLHKGEDSEFYLLKGFRVVGVEADPDLCTEAASRLAKFIEAGQLTIVNAAVAPVAGPIRFYRNVRSEWGTGVRAWSRQNARQGCASVEIEVDGVTLGELVGRYGMPFYMKVDLEGMDRLVLASLEAVAERPRYVSMESAFPRDPSFRNIRTELETLARLGYDRFKIVPQDKVPRQAAPYPARVGQFVPFRFAPGSSGMFGEEAPGAWLSKKEALAAFRQIVRRSRPQSLLFRNTRLYNCYGRIVERLTGSFPHLGWYDIHAKHSSAG